MSLESETFSVLKYSRGFRRYYFVCFDFLNLVLDWYKTAYILYFAAHNLFERTKIFAVLNFLFEDNCQKTKNLF